MPTPSTLPCATTQYTLVCTFTFQIMFEANITTIVWDLLFPLPHRVDYDPRLDMRIQYRPTRPDIYHLVTVNISRRGGPKLIKGELQSYIEQYIQHIVIHRRMKQGPSRHVWRRLVIQASIKSIM